MTVGFTDLFVSAGDGVRLYARDYGSRQSENLPVVCLPGFARTSMDFDELAMILSSDADHPRRVLALDYRGRGRSEWDKDWRRYDPRIELDDTIQVLIAAGIEEAVFVGTSRGGLVIMGLGAVRPSLIRGAVLNDVGPIIEGKGLIRIRGYVGKLPMPRSYDEGGEILRRIMDAQFPGFDSSNWRRMAEGTWEEKAGALVPRYDPNLLKVLEEFDLETPLPELWSLFAGLKGIPVLALRGALSDLLSDETFAAMQKAHPQLEAMKVPDQGHAPVLAGELARRIAEFVRRVEDEAPRP
jgi:pimeloyl-ACP methyl ester carboxylesterase